MYSGKIKNILLLPPGKGFLDPVVPVVVLENPHDVLVKDTIFESPVVKGPTSAPQRNPCLQIKTILTIRRFIRMKRTHDYAGVCYRTRCDAGEVEHFRFTRPTLLARSGAFCGPWTREDLSEYLETY